MANENPAVQEIIDVFRAELRATMATGVSLDVAADRLRLAGDLIRASEETRTILELAVFYESIKNAIS